MKKTNILLVEDDLSLVDGLNYALKKHGFEPETARTVDEANRLFEDGKYDLLILDLALPDGTGFEICQRVRRVSKVPIIFLTASDEEVNVVMGLDMGGDDYITKPFKMAELVSRMSALLRRAKDFRENAMSSNGISLLPMQGQAAKDGVMLNLTAAEYKLLAFFMQNPGAVLSKEQILDRLWDSNFVDDNTLAVYIRRLRVKIEDDPNNPKLLVTVRGMGYRWG
jgi:DNA-binding response OmpR family regulator